MKRGPVYATPFCPQDTTHGRLLDWPTATAAYYCPSSSHVGTPFHNTDLVPTPRAGTDSAAPPSRVESVSAQAAGKHLARHSTA